MADEPKYLTFTPWQGDLNNTRMCFETALVLAWLTRRCLVMPRDYRQHHEPDTEAGRFRPLHPGECFALETLDGIVSRIPRNEYDEFDKVDIVFKPGTTVFCFPKIPAPNSPEAARLVDFALSRKGFLEITPEMEACRTLNLKSATLENFYSFFYFSEPEVERDCKQLIKDHVRFREPIVSAARSIAGSLGNYRALHVRRNDFLSQFPAQNIPPHRLLNNVMRRVPPGTRLYIATDEKDHSFFDCLRCHYQVHFVDHFQDHLPAGIPVASLACVEQMICALAGMFIGTRLSTFSAYINRLRGYYDLADKNCYFTDGSPGSETDDLGMPRFSWTNWVKGGNPLWGREFREAWEFPAADVPITSGRSSREPGRAAAR